MKRLDPEYLRGLSDYADKQMSEAFGDAADEIERLRARLAEAERLLQEARQDVEFHARTWKLISILESGDYVTEQGDCIRRLERIDAFFADRETE